MGCKRFDRCIICVLFQISWQLQTQIVKNRIVNDSLLGNKLYVLGARNNLLIETALLSTIPAADVLVKK